MPEMISLAFESDWHLTSHWVEEGFVLFTPHMQISSNLAALRLHFREKQHSTALLIGPYAYPRTFLLTSWPYMYVWMQISALLDMEGLVGRHMTQSQSIGWLFAEQINVNVSVVSLYMLLGPWKHLSVVGKIMPDTVCVHTVVSLFHIRNEWLDLE